MPSIIDVSLGKSLFQFIDEIWLANPQANNRAVHRLCTLMRKVGANSVIKETISENSPEVITETNALKARLGENLFFKIYRVTFLQNEITSGEDLDVAPEKNCYLSSSFIINITLDQQRWHSYIFYSIVAIPKKLYDCGKSLDLLNNYINIKKNFPCTITRDDGTNHEFSILGNFFSQQNGYTSVCAHATLCMAINNSPFYEGDLIFPETINKELNIDHKTHQLNGSIEVPRMFEFLDKLNISYVSQFFIENEPNNNFSEHLYRYIESKCSSMLLFTTDNSISHIVPIVGHTLNTDLWRPEGELAYSTRFGETNYRSAAAWVDHLIIHDDNFGMYYCLPTDSFKPMSLEATLADPPDVDPPTPIPATENSFRSQLAISLIPHGIVMQGSQAEWAAITLLEAIADLDFSAEVKALFWMKQLKAALVKSRLNPIVARTFLTTKEQYISCFPSPSSERTMIFQELPTYFWLIEISIPDLYTANKSQIAEIAIKSDVQITDSVTLNASWIYIRVPGIIALKSKESSTDFLTPSSEISHIPIIRLSPSPHTNEW